MVILRSSIPLLLVLFIGQCHSEEDVTQTGDVVTNIAYFHFLDCFATVGSGSPLHKLLQLSLDKNLYASAKRRASECPTIRRTTISPNLTEVFLVSEIEKAQLNAESRERMRNDSDGFRHVDETARVMHAAFYSSQFDIVFDAETTSEKADVGQALDGTFSFGCDMNVCKEDDGTKSKQKAITVCHFVRGVSTPKRMISKAEADRRSVEEQETSSSSKEKSSSEFSIWNGVFWMIGLSLF